MYIYANRNLVANMLHLDYVIPLNTDPESSSPDFLRLCQLVYDSSTLQVFNSASGATKEFI
jgi:hypothetical protein